MMRSILIPAMAAAMGMHLGAQTCTLVNTTNCLATGSPWAGPPSFQTFLSGAATSLNTTLTWAAPLPQARMILSAQLVPASQAYITSDPHTCPGSGTCAFNSIAGIEGYIDSLTKGLPNGAGLQSLDINPWLGPIFMTGEYSATCATYGSCFQPSGTPLIGSNCTGAKTGNSGWYCNGLSTYDAVIGYLLAKSPSVLLRIGPTPSADVLTSCGITTGTGNYTEAQLQACLVPLYVAFAKRYHIDYFTLIHEPCGVWANILKSSGCVLSVSDANAFIRVAAAAVHATSKYSGIKLGAGALTVDDQGDTPNHNCGSPGANSFWCDWITNLMASSGSNNVLDFAGLDMYPNQAAPSINYFTGTSGVLYEQGQMINSVPAGKERWANESSSLRWGASSGGESNTFIGCGAIQWWATGLFAAWARSTVGVWAPAHNFTGFSLFASEPLIYQSYDINNTHCAPNSDNYDAAVMAHVGGISPAGMLWGQIARGFGVALQGRASISGRARLGH